MPKGIRLVRIQTLKLSVFLIFLIPLTIKANFSFNHPTCKVRALVPNNAIFLKETLNEMAKKRNMQLTIMKNQKDIYKGDMYFKVEFARINKKIYDHCVVKIKLKLAKEDRRTSNKDQILYQNDSTRSLPRITMKGNERCKKALKDNFVHIPTCIKK